MRWRDCEATTAGRTLSIWHAGGPANSWHHYSHHRLPLHFSMREGLGMLLSHTAPKPRCVEGGSVSSSPLICNCPALSTHAVCDLRSCRRARRECQTHRFKENAIQIPRKFQGPIAVDSTQGRCWIVLQNHCKTQWTCHKQNTSQKVPRTNRCRQLPRRRLNSRIKPLSNSQECYNKTNPRKFQGPTAVAAPQGDVE